MITDLANGCVIYDTQAKAAVDVVADDDAQRGTAGVAGADKGTLLHLQPQFPCHLYNELSENDGSHGKAAQLAAHESERTTRLYDRSDDPVTLDEIERVNCRSNS